LVNIIAEETIEFIRHLQDQRVIELPALVTFECELSKPNVKVQWTKAGKPIVADKKYDITVDGTVHRLIVRDVNGAGDVAEYTASARGLTSKGFLTIQGSLTLVVYQLVVFLHFSDVFI